MSLQAGYSSRRTIGVNDPGKLDRRVLLQTRAISQAPDGEINGSWNTVATVWAQKKNVSSARFFAAESKHAENLISFRIRWRADVQPFMRLVHGLATFEILGCDEQGRQHYLDCICRAIDQQLVLKAPDFNSDFSQDFAATPAAPAGKDFNPDFNQDFK